MSRNKHWELPLEIWEVMEKLIPKKKKDERKGGRPSVAGFKVASGIFYTLSTGIQWKAVPKEFGSGSTIHRYFQEWTKAGVFSSLWREGLIEYDEEKKLKFAGNHLIHRRLSRRSEASLQAQTRQIGVN